MSVKVTALVQERSFLINWLNTTEDVYSIISMLHDVTLSEDCKLDEKEKEFTRVLCKDLIKKIVEKRKHEFSK